MTWGQSRHVWALCVFVHVSEVLTEEEMQVETHRFLLLVRLTAGDSSRFPCKPPSSCGPQASGPIV